CAREDYVLFDYW
nr:immunoglobulin heavy chain junction region [Mus musculus]